MNINFPSVDEEFIKSKVEAGYYSNATELVRDAVRRMREDNETRERLRAALRLGEEQVARGETIGYTADLLDRLAENAIRNAVDNKPVKHAVQQFPLQ